MQTSLSPSVCRAFLRCQIEKAVDELNLAKKVVSCHPSNLSLPDHMNRFVTLYRSPSRLEFSEVLLGVHSTFDGSMILFEDVVQVLHRSVPTALADWDARLARTGRGKPARLLESLPHDVIGSNASRLTAKHIRRGRR
jgi:hypothetical protein